MVTATQYQHGSVLKGTVQELSEIFPTLQEHILIIMSSIAKSDCIRIAS
jgi:hypothetical protein